MRTFLQPLLVVLVWLLEIHNVSGMVTAATSLDKPQKCTLERAYKMLGYNCAKLSLKTIPQNLKSNVEILDLSFNRIRDIDRQSFSKYDDIKYLYLQENMIQNLEDNCFAHLQELEAIDLSYNALTTIPTELFSLPLLRNLYMQGNALLHLTASLETVAKPIQAPLQILNLAECRLKNVPNFGVLTELYYLNVSGNSLFEVTPQTFSPLCHMKIIDLNNTRMDPCECHLVTKHLKMKGVTIKNLEYCDADDVECHFKKNATLETADHAICMTATESKVRNQKATMNWLTIGGILVGFLVLFIGVLYIIHRRNARMIKRRIEADRIKQIMGNGNNSPREKMIKKSNGVDKRPASDNSV